MYNSFIARNFRCFRELRIDSLSRINLIAGKNNVGKSALLEALFLHCGAYNPKLFMNLNAFRGIERIKVEFGEWDGTPWDSMFNEFDTSRNIELVGRYKKEKINRKLSLKSIRDPSDLDIIAPPTQYSINERKGVFSSSEVSKVLELEYKKGRQSDSYYLILGTDGIVRLHPIPPAPPHPAFYHPARMRTPFKVEAERFGNLEKQGNASMLLEVLKIMESRFKRLTMIFEADQPILHGDIGGGRLLQLPLMGEGMARITSLVLLLANAPNGIVLIDEIENGIHHSIMTMIWEAIAKVARKFNTQIFATTHSRECIMSAHRAFKKSKPYDFRLHRLDRVEDVITHKSYDKESLEAAIETGLEVR